VELAELVVEAEVFPIMLNSLTDKDEYVRKNTATLIREIAKHTPEVRWGVALVGWVGGVFVGYSGCVRVSIASA